MPEDQGYEEVCLTHQENTLKFKVKIGDSHAVPTIVSSTATSPRALIKRTDEGKSTETGDEKLKLKKVKIVDKIASKATKLDKPVGIINNNSSDESLDKNIDDILTG